VAVLLYSGGVADPGALQAQTIGLLLGAVAGLAWLVGRWNSLAGRWMVVVALASLAVLLHLWRVAPGTLTLIAIPIALAAALIGLPAAFGAALATTLVLALLGSSPGGGTLWTEVAVALACVWSVLGVIAMAYRPVQQLGGWLEEYFERARLSLEEARGRKAELEQALESLAHANRQLALASQRNGTLRRIAEQAERTKATFVANVSHEFRTPLNMIIGLVDLIAEAPEIYAVSLSPKMRDDLGVVHRNCEHLSKMIDDVLDLTRAEAGQISLHKERVDLRSIIDNSVSVVRPLLEKKRLSMRVEVADEVPDVYCDGTRIQQVILNLLSNAARFTDEGGIALGAIRQDGLVLVTVTDTGPGIATKDADRVFEPFVQATGSRWQGKDGSGLGLSISKQFVRLHGGRMWLESELGAGTSFHFTLPISAPVEPVAKPAHRIREDWVWLEPAFQAARAGSSKETLRPRVIVCDESGTIAQEFARHDDVVEFVGTRGVPDTIRELDCCPAHVVLVNAAAPDGIWPVVEAVSREAPGTPVIGYSVPRLAQRALGAGARGHLVKPVTRADLRAALHAVGKPVRRVLIVDDDPDVLGLFSRMLHVCDETIEVLTANSGRDGLDLVRRARPDLVLLDIVMPEMDGWQVLEEIVRDRRTEQVPVYFVSAQDAADEPLRSRFMLVAMGDGIPLTKLLQCSLQTSARLLMPVAAPGPAPQSALAVARVSAGTTQHPARAPAPPP